MFPQLEWKYDSAGQMKNCNLVDYACVFTGATKGPIFRASSGQWGECLHSVVWPSPPAYPSELRACCTHLSVYPWKSQKWAQSFWSKKLGKKKVSTDQIQKKRKNKHRNRSLIVEISDFILNSVWHDTYAFNGNYKIAEGRSLEKDMYWAAISIWTVFKTKAARWCQSQEIDRGQSQDGF